MVIALSSPLLIGIYENGNLTKEYKRSGRTSEILPLLISEILEEYELRNIYFANGPGSFMAIKVAYVFLQTLSISLNVDIFAADGFCFNDNSPIRAMKQIYFVKEEEKISMRKIEKEMEEKFILPDVLQREIFSKDCDPLYILPAV